MATASSCEEQEPVTIADRVFNQLREAILGGKMAPGQKISEPELASSYGVSRGSLREAIARLEGVTRSAIDQRISRAYKRLARSMKSQSARSKARVVPNGVKEGGGA